MVENWSAQVMWKLIANIFRHSKLWFAVFTFVMFWVFFGIVSCYGEWGVEYDFFFKARPTFLHFSFHDFYAGPAYDFDQRYQDSDGTWSRGTEEFEEFSAYCKHRYGLEDMNNFTQRAKCRNLAEKVWK